jgi:predicted pyridoxine 5'-phosphate oxidase superfamily flavin-nucleotide-binding protein
MEIPTNVAKAILETESKALASYGPCGINAVPVSTVRVVDNKILLMNYFLGKTLQNIRENPHVSLAVWSGFEGYQIKGQASYQSSGDDFEEAREWVNEHVPNRTLLGLLTVVPEEIFNISPGAN